MGDDNKFLPYSHLGAALELLTSLYPILLSIHALMDSRASVSSRVLSVVEIIWKIHKEREY